MAIRRWLVTRMQTIELLGYHATGGMSSMMMLHRRREEDAEVEVEVYSEFGSDLP